MKLNVIDSHTGGEPTRVVLAGQLPLLGRTMAERRDDFRNRFDNFRSGIVNEPRGSEVIVGALLTAPVEPGSYAGVIFFNNAGYLGMCGHGTIGVVETLRHLGHIGAGDLKLDTPVGQISITVAENGEVTLTNIRSYRHLADVSVEVDGVTYYGDVAYGGNWFYVVHSPEFEIDLSQTRQFTELTLKIRAELHRQGITGADGAEIDHVELTGPSAIADSKNFVLCPGGAYDRSPCGTGTSAKMAALHAGGKLAEATPYRQESVTGSVFTGTVTATENGVIPTITGRAHVTAEATLIFDSEDPIRWGLQS